MYKNSPTEYPSFIIVYGEGVTSMPRFGSIDGYDSTGNWKIHATFDILNNGAGEYPLSNFQYYGTVTRFKANINNNLPPIPGQPSYRYSATVTGNVITINKL